MYIKEPKDIVRSLHGLRVSFNAGKLDITEVREKARSIFIAYRNAHLSTWDVEKGACLIANYMGCPGLEKAGIKKICEGDLEEPEQKVFIEKLRPPIDVLILSMIAEEMGYHFFLPKPAPSKEKLERQQAVHVYEKVKAELALKAQRSQSNQHQQKDEETSRGAFEQQYHNLTPNHELHEHQRYLKEVKDPKCLGSIKSDINLDDAQLEETKKEQERESLEQTRLVQEEFKNVEKKIDEFVSQENGYFPETYSYLTKLKNDLESTASQERKVILQGINQLSNRLNEVVADQKSIADGIREELHTIYQNLGKQGEALPEQACAFLAIEEKLNEAKNRIERELIIALEKYTPNLTALQELPGLPKNITKSITQFNEFSLSLSDEATIRQRFSELHSKLSKEDLSKIYVSPNVTGENESLRSLHTRASNFIEGNKKVMLILGDSGQGKSTFGKRFIIEACKHYSEQKPIPLFISLSSIQNPKADILEQYLIEELKFTQSQLKKVKHHFSFILFLDGYDEVIGFAGNIFRVNKLHEWKIEKTFITCRSNSHYLERGSKSFTRFYPIDEDKSDQEELLEVVTLKPFNQEQIAIFIQQYVAQNNTGWKDWKDYYNYFEEHPEISSLISNPFLLEIAIKVLPEITQQNANKANTKELTAAKLREAFISDWFNQSVKKFELQQRTFEDGEPITVEELERFALDLAEEMKNSNTTSVIYKPINRRIPSSFEATDEEQAITQKWENFFGNKHDLILLREGCPLLMKGANEHAFIHTSILEFFIAKRKAKAIKDAAEETGNLNQKRLLAAVEKSLNDAHIITCPEVLKEVSELIGQDEKSQAICMNIVQLSKTDPSKAIASANAISILNHLGHFFPGKDLSKIKAKSASLEGGNFDGADFSDAELSFANFRHSCIDNACFRNATVSGIEFGAKPNLVGHTSPILSIAANREGRLIASTSKDGTVRLWDIEQDRVDILPRVDISKNENKKVESAYAISFSSDSHLLAWGGTPKRIALYDISKKEKSILSGHKGRVLQVCFDNEQKKLASSAEDETIRIWDVASKKCIEVLSTSQASHSENAHPTVSAISISPGLCYQKVPGDGHCLYHAVSLYVGQDQQFLRTTVAEYIEHNLNEFRHFFAGSLNITAYIQRIRSGREWADNIEIEVLMRVLNRPIIVIDQAGAIRNKDAAQREGEPIFVYYNGFTHYDALLLEKGYNGRNTLNELIGRNTQSTSLAQSNAHFFDALCFSPDGEYLASGGKDKIIRLWSVKTWKVVRALSGCAGEITSLAFSHDGRWLAIGSSNASIYIWDMLNQAPFLCLTEHAHKITKVLFLEAGRESYQLASASFDGVICVWDLYEENRLLQKFMASESEINGLGFYLEQEKGRTVLLSAGKDSLIHRWELGGRFAKQDTHKSDVTCLALSPDGSQLVSGSHDRILMVWNPTEGKLKAKLQSAKSWISQVCYSSDGKRIASCGWEKNIYIWDVSTKEAKLLKALEGYSDRALSINFSKNGKHLVSGYWDKNILIWDLETEKIKILSGHSQGVSACKFTNNDEVIVSGSYDNSIRLWDRHGKQIDGLINKQSDGIRCVDVLPNGSLIASGAGDKTICLWNPHTKQTSILLGHTDCVESVAFSSDGQCLVSASKDKTVKVWDVQTGVELCSFEAHKKGVNTAIFSPNAQVIFTAGNDKAVKAWGLQRFNDKLKTSLLWTSNPIFSCKGADFSEAKGLSAENIKLLQQHGAIVPTAAERDLSQSPQHSPGFWGAGQAANSSSGMRELPRHSPSPRFK